MKKYISMIMLVIGVCCIPQLYLQAAVKKPVKKPPVRIIKGTTQLKGEDKALIGETYTLGKVNPINITVKSLEYTVKPVRLGNSVITVYKEEKLLVMHYTLHNPNKADFGIGWSTLNFIAVDSSNTNWRYNTAVAMEDTGANCNMTLKPGQKTNLYILFKVPAKGEIPKIVIEKDRLVLRYDIKGKVKSLPSPIADPSDPSGATALTEVPAKMNEYLPLLDFTINLENVAFTSNAIKDRLPKKGYRYLVATIKAKNDTPFKIGYAWSTIKPELLDIDDMPISWNSSPLRANSDEGISMNIEPGKEIGVRFYFEVPEKVSVKSINFRQGADGRRIVYDISSVNN